MFRAQSILNNGGKNIFIIKLKIKMLLYVLIMSYTCFRKNLHSIVAWLSMNSLLETSTILLQSFKDFTLQSSNTVLN